MATVKVKLRGYSAKRSSMMTSTAGSAGDSTRPLVNARPASYPSSPSTCTVTLRASGSTIQYAATPFCA